MPSTIIASGTLGNSPHATGMPNQQKAVWGPSSQRWWAFAFTGTTTLASFYSGQNPSDLATTTWTAGATLTLGQSHSLEGRNLSVACASIGGTDCFHITAGYWISGTSQQQSHIRAYANGGAGTTTIVFNAENQYTGGTGSSLSIWTDGNVTAFDSANKIWESGNFASGLPWRTDAGQIPFTTADTGATTWTNTVGTIVDIDNSLNGDTTSNFLAALASSEMVQLHDNANATGAPTDIFYSVWSGTVWSPLNPCTSAVGATFTAIGDADWGASARTTTDIHLLIRKDATSTFTHRRGTVTGSTIAWAAGSAVGNHTSLSNGGVTLSTDGTSVWAFILDTASNNPIFYNVWTSGGGWAGWTSLISAGSNPRSNLIASPTVKNSQIALTWTEGAASAFGILSASLNLAVADTFPAYVPVITQMNNPNYRG